MRVVQSEQLTIGEIDISKIVFDLKSRDDIPKILKGLQFVYTNLALREEVFDLLQSKVAPKVRKDNGRPGMPLWTILVCGVVRLDLNIDYDRLYELANQHITLRKMFGHGAFEDVHYHFQTLKDNVSLLTPALLDEINQLVVKSGHVLLQDPKTDKKKTTQRCVGGAIPLCLKPMCTFPPTATCSMMQCARSSPSRRSGATTLA